MYVLHKSYAVDKTREKTKQKHKSLQIQNVAQCQIR